LLLKKLLLLLLKGFNLVLKSKLATTWC